MTPVVADDIPFGRFDEGFLRKLEALAIVAKRSRGGDARAERRSRRVGAGVEFADHRKYAPGDDVRALDWNLLARLDRPFVRLREEEEDLTVTVLVDGSASMGTGAPPKFELAVRVAAALAYVGLAALDRVGVAVVAAGVEAHLPAVRGKAAVRRVLALLATARAQGRTDLTASVGQLYAGARPAATATSTSTAPPSATAKVATRPHRTAATRRSSRRGSTVLISDFLVSGGPATVLNKLRAARQDVVVVQVTADADATVSYDGDVVLEDAETGETRAMTMTEATRRAHGQRYESVLRGVAAVCRKRGLPCFQVTSDVPFEVVVLRILRAGGVLA